MRAMMVFGLLGSLGFAACGGDANPNDEGSQKCNYTEATDVTNNTDAEATNLMVGKQSVLCGTIDNGHYDAVSKIVDEDHFRITTDGLLNLVVRGSGGPGVETAGDFSVLVFDTADAPTLLYGASNSPTVADHAAFIAALPAGTYDVVVVAKNSADLVAPFDYKVRLTPDEPTRCPILTDKAAYTEAGDGDGTGNDMIASSFASDPPWKLTDSADAAEATGLTIDAKKAVRISGSSAMVNAADDYMDRDTYLVTTGPKTNELTLRLNWADAGTDLDFALFEADQANETGDSLLTEPMQEYNAIAVKPATAYWVWIGAHDGSTALPEAYDLSVCGTVFTP